MQTDVLLIDVAIDSGVVESTTHINVLYDTKGNVNSQRINASIEMRKLKPLRLAKLNT